MARIAIVYIAHDGFISLYTGVGTIARDFLLSFSTINNKLKKEFKGIKLDLYATTIKYNDKCFGYSENIKKTTERLTKVHKNIHLIELINGSAGTKSYGSKDCWRNASISAATFLYSLIQLSRYDRILVICVDTPFAQVPNYFFDQYNYDFIDFIWLPQSTALIHKIDSAIGISSVQDNYIQDRFKWEKGVVDLSKVHKQVKIGAVGNFMKQHLIASYGADEKKLVLIQNSLFLKRLKSYKLKQNEIASKLMTLGVPLDRPLLFSFGRAELYKGLDLVLKNSFELIQKQHFFILILASPYSMEDKYVKELKQLAEQYPLDIKIVFGLDFLTPHYIMQWKNTKILALLSRAEPFGLIPIESRFYNNKNISIVATKDDGFLEQIADGVDGFLVDLNGPAISSIFSKVANLNKQEKLKIAKNGYLKILSKYDQVKIDYNFLKSYILSI